MVGRPARELEARERLARVAALADREVELASTGLALSALERPASKPEDYIPQIDALAGELAGEAGPRPDAARQSAALAAVFGDRYRSCDDGEAAEAGLMEVIDSRRGPAEALGILALDAARRLGWRADGLAFPSRFLLRLEDRAGRRIILNPACGWRAVEPPDLRTLLKSSQGGSAELAPAHYAPLGNRDILVRLQNAAKHRLLRRGRIAEALAVVEATLLFAPGQTLLWREAGLMHLRLDRLAAAVAALEQFVARTGNPQARRRTADLLHQLRSRLS